MLPVIALVGRPNVGKSTLFNRLTRSRDALVADLPGLTRDRQYGQGSIESHAFIVIDTGGITGDEQGIDSKMAQQSLQAVVEADIVLFLVDARAGLTASDELLAKQLRQSGKTIHLVVNKIDGLNPDEVLPDFYSLGFESVMPIAAAHGRGVNRMITDTLEQRLRYIQAHADPLSLTDKALSLDAEVQTEIDDHSIKLAIIGRPNVGKSTLLNRILGEERVVVFDMPGTTRDSVYVPMLRNDQRYTLIDTAGVRRRGKVKETVEKFSVIKTLQAVNDAHVVVMVFDAREGLTDQDLNILGFALDAGRSLVIALNKWDGMEQEQKQWVKQEIQRRLAFVDFAKIHFISALHGTGVGELFRSVNQAYQSSRIDLSTNKMTQLLEKAVTQHQPPMVQGRRIKLRYAHLGGQHPPIIVIHGNQTDKLPTAYQRYLVNFYRDELKLVGTPIRIELKTSENPFKGRKNKLTERQVKSKQRLMRFTKQGKGK